MDTAAAVGTGNEATGGTGTGTGTGGGSADPESYYNMSAMDVLKKLPGITEHNYRKVLTRVKNLAELSSMSLSDLSDLIGKISAKKLYAFFHTTL